MGSRLASAAVKAALLSALAILVAVPTTAGAFVGTLWDQYDNAGTSGAPSQNFEPAMDGFDAFAADDFQIPDGDGWLIQGMAVDGQYQQAAGPAGSVSVSFFKNNHHNLPGANVAGFGGFSYGNGPNPGDFVMGFPTAVELGPGTYWVSLHANMASSLGLWVWTGRTVTTLSPAAWMNPNGGWPFGPCASWKPRGPVCGIDPAEPDQVFSLNGHASTTTLVLTTTATEIQASGTVDPVSTGRVKVTLSQDTGSGYVKVETNRPRLDPSSNYSTAFARPTGGGTCKVKAVFPGSDFAPPSENTEITAC